MNLAQPSVEKKCLLCNSNKNLIGRRLHLSVKLPYFQEVIFNELQMCQSCLKKIGSDTRINVTGDFQFEIDSPFIKACLHCSKIIYEDQAKYCSKSCRSKAYYQRKKKIKSTSVKNGFANMLMKLRNWIEGNSKISNQKAS